MNRWLRPTFIKTGTVRLMSLPLYKYPCWLSYSTLIICGRIAFGGCSQLFSARASSSYAPERHIIRTYLRVCKWAGPVQASSSHHQKNLPRLPEAKLYAVHVLLSLFHPSSFGACSAVVVSFWSFLLVQPTQAMNLSKRRNQKSPTDYLDTYMWVPYWYLSPFQVWTWLCVSSLGFFFFFFFFSAGPGRLFSF